MNAIPLSFLHFWNSLYCHIFSHSYNRLPLSWNRSSSEWTNKTCFLFCFMVFRVNICLSRTISIPFYCRVQLFSYLLLQSILIFECWDPACWWIVIGFVYLTWFLTLRRWGANCGQLIGSFWEQLNLHEDSRFFCFDRDGRFFWSGVGTDFSFYFSFFLKWCSIF